MVSMADRWRTQGVGMAVVAAVDGLVGMSLGSGKKVGVWVGDFY